MSILNKKEGITLDELADSISEQVDERQRLLELGEIEEASRIEKWLTSLGVVLIDTPGYEEGVGEYQYAWTLKDN